MKVRYILNNQYGTIMRRMSTFSNTFFSKKNESNPGLYDLYLERSDNKEIIFPNLSGDILYSIVETLEKEKDDKLICLDDEYYLIGAFYSEDTTEIDKIREYNKSLLFFEYIKDDMREKDLDKFITKNFEFRSQKDTSEEYNDISVYNRNDNNSLLIDTDDYNPGIARIENLNIEDFDIVKIVKLYEMIFAEYVITIKKETLTFCKAKELAYQTLYNYLDTVPDLDKIVLQSDWNNSEYTASESENSAEESNNSPESIDTKNKKKIPNLKDVFSSSKR